MSRREATEESLMRQIDRRSPSECWPWLGALDRGGYGKTRGGGAHRMVYKIVRGPIAAGLTVDHICRVRACCNPAHLRLATQAENNQNQRGHSPRSGRRNVHWNNRLGKWQVAVGCGGRDYYGGVFTDVEEADRAAQRLRDALFTHHTDTPAKAASS